MKSDPAQIPSAAADWRKPPLQTSAENINYHPEPQQRLQSRHFTFYILEDFLFNPNMFRMSVSTGQLDIGPVDAEFISDNNKRKSKKKRFFPNPAQLLSRYSGKRNYRV